MARVPTYDSFQAAPTVMPTPRVEGVASAELASISGRQQEALGNNVLRAGVIAGSIETDIQQQANQLRVNDALNQTKEIALRLQHDKDSGFSSLKGWDALNRPDGKPLAEEYGEKLQSQIDTISGTLGNDAQKQAFALHSGSILSSLKGAAISHESQEFKTYGLSVAEGVQATALRDIGMNWNNPEAVNKAVERIKAETFRQATLLGKSAEWQEAQSRKLASNGHKVALLSALENNDPAYAEAYLKKYSPQMDADDILAVRGHITKEMDARVGMTAASEVVRSMAPRIATGDTERAFNIAVGTESGGRQFGKDGQPLTSPKGAVGIAQVMPATAPEAAKLAGLPWDENRYKTDANYNKAIGMAYFQKQLQDNNGDLEKAYAAYNAGPGALQNAVKKAEQSVKLNKTDPTVQPHTWLDFMPAETKAYVAKNMNAYEAGQGQNSRPTFAEIDDALRQRPELASNPHRYKLAREEAQRQFTEQTQAIKQRDEEAVATAMRGVIENGGRFSDLPVSIRAALPPKEVDNVLGFAQKISKGDDTTSLWLYSKLTNQPEYLAGLSDNQFFALRKELSESDYKHFDTLRSKLRGNAPTGGAGDLNTSAIKTTLDERLRMLKIDPTPKDDGGADAARIGGVRRFVDQYFMTAQREAGKKFTDAEVSQHIDALFAKNATFRGLFSNSSGPMLTMKASDLSSTDKDAIKAAYKKQGVDDPTDAQIMNAYWTAKIARK